MGTARGNRTLNYWTPEQDRVLFSIAEKNADLTHAQVASLFTTTTGIPTSEDGVRNRLKRIRADIELNNLARQSPAHEEPFALTPVPEGEFVGFRMGFFDIETTGLTAMIGRLLSCSIADNFGNLSTATIIDLPGKTIIDDSVLAEWYRDELEKYDILVGWNSKLYDIPMLNARLMRWGRRPIRGDMMHADIMWNARPGKAGIRIGSSKLDNVAKFFRTRHQKTEIDWDTWTLAGTGDADAIAEVTRHGRADVLVTRDVFNHLKPLIKNIHR